MFCVHHALADDGLGVDRQRWRCLVGVDYGFCRHGSWLGIFLVWRDSLW